MKVRFWGTRGSIPKSGPATLRYGGDTACVELRGDAGDLVVIDCGTGAHALGAALTAGPAPVSGTLLISHMHWDHIQGLPFFAPLFQPGAVWDIYAPRGLGQPLRDTLAGQMRSEHFPVALEDLGAEIRFHELLEGDFSIGDLRVRAQYLDHPALTLGYRIEGDGATVVYASDHESSARVATPGPADLAGPERRHVDFLRDADLVIHDAQYQASEYPDHVGWGHATGAYAVAVCKAAGAARLRLIHHDPWRSDDAIDAIVAALRADDAPPGLDVAGAAVGAELVLSGGGGRRADATEAATAMARPPVPDARVGQRIGLGPMRPAVAAVLTEAAATLGLPVGPDGEGVTLRIVDAAMQDAPADAARDAATVIEVVEPPAADCTHGAHARMMWPFSRQYAQARLHAAAMGRAARWARAAPHRREQARLSAVCALGLTPGDGDARFTRLTRMAAAAFGAPVAFVSVMNEHTQHILACVGADVRETPREVAFCAHTIAGDAMLVVPDALLDDRFAENPLVVHEPRVRFYAGCPLRSRDGHVVGTLCLIDMRPRDLTPVQRDLLADFGALAEAAMTADAATEPAALNAR